MGLHRVDDSLLLYKTDTKDANKSTKSMTYDEEKGFKVVVPQIIAAILSGYFHMLVGISISYSAILIPQLLEAQENDEEAIKVTKTECSWIASSFPLVVPISAVVAGFLTDIVGRLNMIRLAVIPSFLGWVLIAISENVTVILIGRVLTGIASNWGTAPAIVYITEISRADIRGTLTSVAPVFISLGMCVTFLKGWFLSWRLIAWLCSVYSILPIILIMFIPESPAWLIAKGNTERARKSLVWFYKYHSQDDQMVSSFANMKLNEMYQNHSLGQQSLSLSNKLKTFLQPIGYKPLLILTGIHFFQQFSGIFVLTYHGVTFFKEVGADIDPYFSTVMIGVVRLTMAILSSWLFKLYRKRSLYFVSSLGMFVTLGISALFTKWIKEGTCSMGWVPVLMILLYIMFSSVAVLPLPFVMSAELFPISVRGIAYNLILSINQLFMFFVLQCYFDLSEFFGGSYGVQFFYAIVSLAGMVYSYVFLPETFKKELSDIENYFWKHTTYLSVRD